VAFLDGPRSTVPTFYIPETRTFVLTRAVVGAADESSAGNLAAAPKHAAVSPSSEGVNARVAADVGITEDPGPLGRAAARTTDGWAWPATVRVE